jgi:hypothetical protein
LFGWCSWQRRKPGGKSVQVRARAALKTTQPSRLPDKSINILPQSTYEMYI